MDEYFSRLLDNSAHSTRPLLTVREVSRLLNIHVNTVRRWSDNDIIKSYRINPRGDRRFRKDEIARFISKYDDFNLKKPTEMN